VVCVTTNVHSCVCMCVRVCVCVPLHAHVCERLRMCERAGAYFAELYHLNVGGWYFMTHLYSCGLAYAKDCRLDECCSVYIHIYV